MTTVTFFQESNDKENDAPPKKRGRAARSPRLATEGDECVRPALQRTRPPAVRHQGRNNAMRFFKQQPKTEEATEQAPPPQSRTEAARRYHADEQESDDE